MNSLFISPNSPYISVGGIERYVKNLINYCSRQEGEHIIVLPANGKELQEKNGNVEIYFSDFLNLSYKDRTSTNQRKISQIEIRKKTQAFFEYLLRTIANEKIDIINAENFHLGLPPAYSLMLNMACISTKTPLVLRLHSYPTKPIHEEIINNLFWDKVICVSKSVAGDCFSKGADINKLETRYLGVDISEFRTDLDDKWLKRKLNLPWGQRIILCASRIIQGPDAILKEKGLINLVEAFSKISPRYANLTLVIAVGKPPEALMHEYENSFKKLQGYIKLHNVEGKVVCYPFNLSEMPLVYRGADIFVLPSENETLGQVYIEAMASGVPVIGTNTGGVPEIISDGYNGYLIEPNNASLLAEMMEKLLNNNKLRTNFVKRALSTVESRLTTEKLFDDLFNFLENLIQSKKTPAL